MKMRLIDADVLEDQLGISDRDIYCKEVIYEAPTIDPIQHGKWIEDTGSQYCGYTGYKCSECDEGTDEPTEFCPNCGAKMDMEEQ